MATQRLSGQLHAERALDETVARLHFVDYLRVALTILVVLHHFAVMYGAIAPFYYVEPPLNDSLAYLVLLVFALANQAFFMGFFFLLAGYFTPRSFDRKGATDFLKDRALRLGIPLIVFSLVLNPIASIGLYQMPSELTGISGPFTLGHYPSLIGVGPLWFVEVLLIFAFGYAAWRLATVNGASRPSGEFSPPSYLAIVAFVLFLALATYLLRIVLPLGASIPILDLPTPAYLPQYLTFFVLGVVAYRRNWFNSIPSSMGKVGFAVALLLTIPLFPIAISGGEAFLGGGSLHSAVYALWDSAFSVGVCLGLLTLFRHWFVARPGGLGRFLYQQAFAVYVVHIPIVVLLGLALRDVHLQQLLKFGLAALVGVPTAFAVAYLVRRIPYASRVL